MLNEINIDWSHVKSYASLNTLTKRINQDKALYPEYNDKFIIVRTPAGRWTAIVILDRAQGGYLARYQFLKI